MKNQRKKPLIVAIVGNNKDFETICESSNIFQLRVPMVNLLPMNIQELITAPKPHQIFQLMYCKPVFINSPNMHHETMDIWNILLRSLTFQQVNLLRNAEENFFNDQTSNIFHHRYHVKYGIAGSLALQYLELNKKMSNLYTLNSFTNSRFKELTRLTNYLLYLRLQYADKYQINLENYITFIDKKLHYIRNDYSPILVLYLVNRIGELICEIENQFEKIKPKKYIINR